MSPRTGLVKKTALLAFQVVCSRPAGARGFLSSVYVRACSGLWVPLTGALRLALLGPPLLEASAKPPTARQLLPHGAHLLSPPCAYSCLAPVWAVVCCGHRSPMALLCSLSSTLLARPTVASQLRTCGLQTRGPRTVFTISRHVIQIRV